MIRSENRTLAELSFRLPNKASVFQAEVFAINQAAIFLQNQTNIFFTKFFIDSQAALLALNNKTVTSRLVGDTMHNLNLIPGNIRLVWIKAHVGHEGNERADVLAKEGTTKADIAQIALPKQATKIAIRNAIDEIWDFQWSQYHDGRQSKQFYKHPDRSKAKYSYNLSRQELGRLIRIVTGHYNLFYHRSNVDKTGGTSSLCRFCQEERETFFHFATSCPCFRLSRFHYFQNDTCFTDEKWSIRKILNFSNIPSIAAALGGNFDPLVHLEQQRDFEDIIEAEQVDADLQPGRRSDLCVHNISTSSAEESLENNSQYIATRTYIQNAHRTHNISTSDSSDVTNNVAVSPTPMSEAESDDLVHHPDPTGVRSALGADAAFGDSDSETNESNSLVQAPSYTTLYNRRKINYDTLEITDDEYLENNTDDED